jgi:hypothetical protein
MRSETIIGLYKTEVVKQRGPWRTVEQIEYGVRAGMSVVVHPAHPFEHDRGGDQIPSHAFQPTPTGRDSPSLTRR